MHPGRDRRMRRSQGARMRAPLNIYWLPAGCQLLELLDL